MTSGFENLETALFTFFVLLSAVVFLVAETRSLWQSLFGNDKGALNLKARVKALLFNPNPKVPLGWALVSAFFLIVLISVPWESGRSLRSQQEARSHSEGILGQPSVSASEEDFENLPFSKTLHDLRRKGVKGAHAPF